MLGCILWRDISFLNWAFLLRKCQILSIFQSSLTSNSFQIRSCPGLKWFFPDSDLAKCFWSNRIRIQIHTSAATQNALEQITSRAVRYLPGYPTDSVWYRVRWHTVVRLWKLLAEPMHQHYFAVWLRYYQPVTTGSYELPRPLQFNLLIEKRITMTIWWHFSVSVLAVTAVTVSLTEPPLLLSSSWNDKNLVGLSLIVRWLWPIWRCPWQNTHPRCPVLDNHRQYPWHTLSLCWSVLEIINSRETFPVSALVRLC